MSQKYLNDLNEEQKIAVTSSIEDPLFIYAGAGSGKTRTLICRIAFMIDNGVRPENILAVTFTRKAAEEIAERMTNYIGPRASNVNYYTFHQLCLNILKQNTEALPFQCPTTGFKIADNSEQRKIFTLAVTKLKANNPSRRDLSLANNIRKLSFKYMKLVNQQKMLGTPAASLDGDLKFVMAFYEESLRKKHMIDFTDFMTLVKKYFKSHPNIAYRYGKIFQYILIDEFQDTSTLNFEILKLLIQPSNAVPINRRVTVVGDPHQSIYSFRGANPKNLEQFSKLFPDARRVLLHRNYRSQASIVRAAASLIKNDSSIQQADDDQMVAMVSEGPLVKLVTGNDAYAEADSICTEIERLVLPGSGISFRDIVIMFRMRKASAEIEMELFRRGIPYTHRRGSSFFARAEVREVVAYCRLALDLNSDEPDDHGLLASAFECVLNVPDRQIRPSVAVDLKREAESRHTNILNIVRMAVNGGLTIPAATAKKLSGFMELLERINRQCFEINDSLATNVILDLIVKMAKLDADYENAGKEREGDVEEFEQGAEETEANDRHETIDLLREEAVRFHMRLLQSEQSGTSAANLRKFINFLTLEQSRGVTRNAVTLSTIHQMKGLEAPVCFLVRFNQDVLPMSDAGGDGEGVSLSEERRIAYVAMTRARQRLFITCALSARGRSLEPSQFLSEIDPATITRDVALTEDEKREVDRIVAACADPDSEDFVIDIAAMAAEK